MASHCRKRLQIDDQALVNHMDGMKPRLNPPAAKTVGSLFLTLSDLETIHASEPSPTVNKIIS